MTRDEILKLEAGRELDMLVAEKVMELIVRCEPQSAFKYEWLSNKNKPLVTMLGSKDGYVVTDHSIYYAWGEIHHYSTDIAAAWEVVQEVYNRKLEQEFLRGLYAQGVIDLPIMVHHSPDIDCRAALLAVMEE